MKQPSKIQKGFLFDYKWIPTLRDLNPEDFHVIFWQLLDFQQSGGSKKIPRHRGRRDLDHIANLIVPQIENRLNGALGGRPTQRPSDPEGGSNPGSTPPTIPPTEGGTVPKISQDKISQDKISQGELPALGGTCAPERAETAPYGAKAATKAAAATGGRKQENYARRSAPDTRPLHSRRDQGSTSSFDLDTFFEAAVRKSLGE